MNKNTFGEEVITAFWLCDTEYYKIDVVLWDKLPLICIYKYKNKLLHKRWQSNEKQLQL